MYSVITAHLVRTSYAIPAIPSDSLCRRLSARHRRHIHACDWIGTRTLAVDLGCIWMHRWDRAAPFGSDTRISGGPAHLGGPVQCGKIRGRRLPIMAGLPIIEDGRGVGCLGGSADRRTESGLRIARRGALINILNPKLSIFFLALLPPFLSGNPATATIEMALMGGIFMLMTFAVFVLYGVFAAAARTWLLGSERVMRWLNRSFALLFAALAGRLALERV